MILVSADRIERCCKTQEIAQAVHGVASLDLKTMQAYVAKTVMRVRACVRALSQTLLPGSFYLLSEALKLSLAALSRARARERALSLGSLSLSAHTHTLSLTHSLTRSLTLTHAHSFSDCLPPSFN